MSMLFIGVTILLFKLPKYKVNRWGAFMSKKEWTCCPIVTVHWLNYIS